MKESIEHVSRTCDTCVMETTMTKTTKQQARERMNRIQAALRNEAGQITQVARTTPLFLETFRGKLQISWVSYGADGLWVHTGNGLNASSFSLGNDGKWAD